jgi:hypothetical protein
MPGPTPSPRENALRLRAKTLLGADTVFVPRILSTRAGGKSGALVFGFLVCRPAPGGPGTQDEVLGVSPPPGSPLDLSQLGTADEALADALRRAKEGLGPYPAEALDLSPPEHVTGAERRSLPPRPDRRMPTGQTTSSIDLPVG